MKLATPFIRLPLAFDAAVLAAEIDAIPEAGWRRHPHGNPGNWALPLVAVHGDPADDETRGPMRPTPHLAALPYTRQVMAALGCTIGRSRLMRIDGNGEAHLHVDTNYYWSTHLRIHVPVVTTPNVAFLCGDARVHMRAGECWVFDTWSKHNVLNPDPTRRIHLVIDAVGSAALWELIERGDRPREFHPPANPTARFVPPGFSIPEVAFESRNQPVVMTPFELDHWIDFTLSECPPVDPPGHATQARLAALCRTFRRRWADLWAHHGEAAAGHEHFRAQLVELHHALQGLEGLRAANGTDATDMLRQLVVRSAVNPQLLTDRTPSGASSGRHNYVAAGAAPAVVTSPGAGRPRLERPVLIVCPPRSGSSLLFETLAEAPGLYTVGGESHALIEAIPALHPASRNFDSNRLTAVDATPGVIAALRQGFFDALRDREGTPPPPDATLRILEKTPKNSLRLPFFESVFPESQLVFLWREPRDTISSMIDAWNSGRFVTYRHLPGWTGLPWSLALPEGWRDWIGRPVEEVAARQWAAITAQLLDDLEALPPERVTVFRHADLLAAPQAAVQRLCTALDLGWDRELAGLKNSRHTLTAPDPDKWKKNAAALERVLPLVAATIDRANRFVAERLAADLLTSMHTLEAARADLSAMTWSASLPRLLQSRRIRMALDCVGDTRIDLELRRGAWTSTISKRSVPVAPSDPVESSHSTWDSELRRLLPIGLGSAIRVRALYREPGYTWLGVSADGDVDARWLLVTDDRAPIAWLDVGASTRIRQIGISAM